MKSIAKLHTRGWLTALIIAVGVTTQILSAADSEQRGKEAKSAPTQHVSSPAKASDLIGINIENLDLQTIGSVQDVAIDLQAGRIIQVIVATKGFLSIRERHVAVPPSHFDFDAASKLLHFDIAMELLQSAPGFTMSHWVEFYQSDSVQESCLYYGKEASFECVPSRKKLPAFATSPNGLGHVERATKLLGLPVKNLQNEKIGLVKDLIVDLPTGRVIAVIVTSGKYLGIRDALSAIPPTALRFAAENDLLRLDTTKKALRNAPSFKAKEWPDFGQRDYIAGLYRAYEMGPDLPTIKTPSPTPEIPRATIATELTAR